MFALIRHSGNRTSLVETFKTGEAARKFEAKMRAGRPVGSSIWYSVEPV